MWYAYRSLSIAREMGCLRSNVEIVIWIPVLTIWFAPSAWPSDLLLLLDHLYWTRWGGWFWYKSRVPFVWVTRPVSPFHYSLGLTLVDDILGILQFFSSRTAWPGLWASMSHAHMSIFEFGHPRVTSRSTNSSINRPFSTSSTSLNRSINFSHGFSIWADVSPNPKLTGTPRKPT